MAMKLDLNGRPLYTEGVTHLVSSPALYSFRIEKRTDLFVILEEEGVDSTSQATSFIGSHTGKGEDTKEVFLNHSELDRLPHDLALSLFTVEKRQTIGSKLGKKGNHYDSYTPDLITGNLIMELGTNHYGSITAYKEKIDKYKNIAISYNCKNVVIAVGPDGITSNIQLSMAETLLISSAYALGKRIQLAAVDYGFIPSHGVVEIHNIISNSCSSILDDKIDKSFLHVEKEEWNSWKLKSAVNPNPIHLQSVYLNLINDSVRDISQVITGTVDPSVEDEKIVSDYIEQVHKLETISTEKRLAVPFTIIKPGNFKYNGPPELCTTEMAELWHEILSNTELEEEQQNYESLKNLSVSVEEEIDLRNSKEHRKIMLESHKTKVSLTNLSEEKLSAKGLNGKKRKRVREINVQHSLGYNIEATPTHDLENFINSGDELFKPIEDTNNLFNSIEPLLSEGGFTEDPISWGFHQWFCSTKLSHAASFLSALFSELNLNYKKPTGKNEFRVSKIHGYPALLATHNTGSNKHTFYTVIVNKESLPDQRWDKCFRQWYDIGNYYCTDLCSTRRHDISNYLFANQKIEALVATHMEVFSEDLRKPNVPVCSPEILFHTLVYLENHNQTSEVLQQVRYFYMKTNESKIVKSKYMTPVEKLPIIIRSRLCCFAIRNILRYFMKMSKDRLCITVKENEELDDEEEEKFSDDFLENVVSYVSGNKIETYEACLLLSYGGIYHNKEKNDPITSTFQIFRKLTSEELKLDETKADEYKNGFLVERAEDIPAHGFSQSHVANCGLAILKNFSDRGITESDLRHMLMIELDKVTFEEMATFKSSLDYEHLGREDISYDVNYRKSNCGSTIRAMEGVVKVLRDITHDENIKPFHMISQLVDLCNDHGGIVTILFKKAQFGSVREIFILTMLARMVVRFVETIARTIAELCPNEYLTKGTDKINSTPDHYTKVRDAKHAGDFVFNSFDSLDCKTWCQNFTFPAFGNLFSILLRNSEDLSHATRNVFNMASSKRHEMPETLMMAFLNNQNVKSMSEGMNELKSNFLSSTGGKLNKGNQSIFVKNVSNFMQGIFHYTSTVMHSGHLLVMQSVFKSYLYHTGLSSRIRAVVHTTKESSDDASSLMTLILKPDADEKERKMARIAVLCCSEALKRSYPLMCAYINEGKSTRCVENGVEEFNSMWTFRNTVLSVPSKFTAAAVCPKITRSCIERQRVDHNLLNSCIENGCSISLVKILEICCATNHYIITGAESVGSEVWSSLSDDIIELSHPSTWLYLSSPKFIGPTLGYEVTMFNHLERSEDGRRTHYTIRKEVAGNFDFKSGFLIQSSMSVGKTDKYRAFKKRMLPSNFAEIEDKIDMNPSVLFMPSVSREDVLTKIYMKACSPGAERSFIFEDESAIHSLSAYTITRPSLTVSVRNNLTWDRRKHSLPSFLSSVQKLVSNREENVEIESFALSILEMSKSYPGIYKPIGRRRKLPVKLRFPKVRALHDIPLSSTAKFHWFGIQNGYSFDENDSAISEYMNLYTWLDKSYSITRKNLIDLGVEGNIHGVIMGLLNTEIDKDRTIMFLHSGKRQSVLTSTFFSCIEYGQLRDTKMSRTEEVSKTSEMMQFAELERSLYPYVCINKVIRQMVDKNRDDPSDIILQIFEANRELLQRPRSDRDVRFLPKKYRNLLAMGICCLADVSNEDKVSAIMKVGSGYILSYEVPQQRVEDSEGNVKWVGEGVFHVYSNGFNAVVHCRDDVLTAVKVEAKSKISSHLKLLTSILKRNGITRTPETRVVDGLKLINGNLVTTNDKGAVLDTFAYMDKTKLANVNIITDLKSKFNHTLVLNIRSVDRIGNTHECMPVKFSPSQSLRPNNAYILPLKTIKFALSKAVELDEDDEIRKFCKESLYERLSLKNHLDDSKFRQFNCILSSRTQADEETKEEDLTEEEAMNIMSMLSNVSNEQILATVNLMETTAEKLDDADGSRNITVATENVVNEADLYSEVKTTNTSPRLYEDLQIWDNLINNVKEATTYGWRDLINGDYFMPPESNNAGKIVRCLLELKLIAPGKPDIDDVAEEEELEWNV